MDRIILVNCAVLLTISLCTKPIYSLQHTLESKEDEDRASKYLWFGPRLGRSKRNPSEDIPVGTLIDILQESPFALVALSPEGKRHGVGFTPRLGRDSFPIDDRWDISGFTEDTQRSRGDSSSNGGEIMTQRSPPFAPRLGRRMTGYAPLLGRENLDKLQP